MELETSSFLAGYWELFEVQDTYTRFTLLISVAIAVALSVFSNSAFDHIDDITSICFDYCPKLIAFGIAAFVFLLNPRTKYIKALSLPISKDTPVITFFCATLTWFMFIVFVVLLIAILSIIIPSHIVYAILYSFIIYVLFLFVHFLLHLFSIHTFFYPKIE